MVNVGDRIELISMVNDPDPVPSGTKGTVYHVGGGVANVNWDNGRNVGIIVGEDRFTIINSK